MKKYLAFLFFLSMSPSLWAQVKISGTLKDNKGRPIVGASLTLIDTYDGTSSDSLGRFSFITQEKGNKTLEIKNDGYNTLLSPLVLEGKPVILNLVLKSRINELKAVNITIGSFAAGDSKRSTILNPIDVATTAGSNADITAALKTLPGTQQVGEQEGLFVRGGTGYETKQYIDGTLVNNPYYSSVPDIAQRGRFSPFLFKGTVFSTGAYSALYGQALSSVLLLQSIDLPEKSELDLTISPLILGLGTQQLAKNKKYSYGFSYDYTNLSLYDALVKQKPDIFEIPQFHNGDANFRIKTANGGLIKFYTTYAFNRLGLRRPDIDSTYLKDAFSLQNHNWYNNLSWRQYLSHGWKLNIGLGYSTNLDKIHQEVQDSLNRLVLFGPSSFWMQVKNFKIQNRQDLSQTKWVFEKNIGGINALRFGAEYQWANNSVVLNDTLHQFQDHYTAGFAESDIFLTNNLAAKIGFRIENSSILQKIDWAPRFSLAYKTGQDAQISAAYGIFYQKPENSILFYNHNLDYTKAVHYLVNYQRMTKDYTLRIEAFYKDYQNLIKEYPLYYNYYSYNNSGKGYAKGIELFWRDKKTFKNLDYWLSYSYLDTKRDYLNYSQELVPSFAAKHTISLVGKRFFTALKSGINFTYSYATGRPYYDFLQGPTAFILHDQGITRDYHSLNLSAEYLPSLGKKNPKSFIVLFASATNILGYNAVYGYNYPFSGNPQFKQPIEPPAKRFFFIGCFISFGVDRSQDAINNNL